MPAILLNRIGKPDMVQQSHGDIKMCYLVWFGLLLNKVVSAHADLRIFTSPCGPLHHIALTYSEFELAPKMRLMT